MTLGLYITRRLIGSFALIAAVFLGVLYLFEMVELVRRLGGSAPMSQLVWLGFLRVPRTLHQILPLIMILSSMALFLAMARSSELVVIRAAGRSALRMLAEPFVATLILGMLAVAVLNPVSALATRSYQAQVMAIQNPEVAMQVGVADGAIWLRQGDPLGQTVIRAERAGPDGVSFAHVTFLGFERETGRPLSRIEAASARLEAGQWRLSDATLWHLERPNPEAESERHDSLTLPTDLTPARLRDSFAQPGLVSVWGLPDLIGVLERAGLSARSQRAELQSELALPVMMAAMMMIGAALCLRHSRAGRTGIRVLATVMAGFALFFLRNFALVLGETGQVALSLAVWTPPIASIMLATGVLLHLEDG
ncbi:MAG: LPS export ABC transporter permease LptG [Pararhodobacter sp.]